MGARSRFAASLTNAALIVAASLASPFAARSDESRPPVPARVRQAQGSCLFTSGSPRAHPALWFGIASAAAVSGAALGDRWLNDESVESRSAGERRLADTAQPFGNPAIVLPATLGVYGAARMFGNAEASRGALRVGASILMAGASALAVKELVGRARPEDSPTDAWSLKPFSGHDSFPSGHAAVAFAAATAIDCETSSRWVPWVVYPAAALVGWSRVHQDEHWTSDVVAGAALGTWTAGRVERWMRGRARSARP